MAADFCPQCDHCNAYKAVTARLSTWNDALNALKNANLPAKEEGPTFAVEDVFALALFLEGTVGVSE